jgi:hypothetical protein
MHFTSDSSASEFAVRQRGERADRIVAIGAFIAFLATGFVVEDPPPRDSGGAAQAVRHAAASDPR